MKKWSVDLNTHRLKECAFSPSPNYDERPQGTSIDLLVVHNISLPPGQFGSTDVLALFSNTLDTDSQPFYRQLKNVKVSAHLFISRTGEVVQLVPFHKRAWHAGDSIYQGRRRCNDFSIGVELEGTDHLPYESLQYEALIGLTKALMKVYPTLKHLTGHSDIAPCRKTDPGPAFDWVYYRQQVMRGKS